MARHPKRIVRIDSDGMPNDVIISLDDGTRLDKITAVDIELAVGRLPTIKLSTTDIPLHVEGQINVVYICCPVCSNEVRHICDIPEDLSSD